MDAELSPRSFPSSSPSSLPSQTQRPPRRQPGHADAVTLTERGLEYPFKTALLSRHGLAEEDQGLLAQVKQFVEVFVAERQQPVSLEPLGPEEQAAIASGQFSTFKRNHQPSGRGHATGGSRGGSRRFESNRGGTGRDYAAEDDKNEETFGSFDPEEKGAFSLSSSRTLERPSSDPALLRPTYDRPVMPLRQFKDMTPHETVHSPTMARHLSDLEEEGAGGHDEESALWAMPAQASRPGTQAAMGVFDDQGRFITRPTPMNRPVAPIGSRTASAPFAPPPAQPMYYGAGYPTAGVPPPVVVPPPHAYLGAAPTISPVPVISPPLITAETRWFYRDPTGAVQGPFANQKMLDWYARQYFPESLPLRRETDPAFETLTQWKIKCGGQPPFALAAKAPAAVVGEQPAPAALAKPDLAPEQRQFLQSLTNRSGGSASSSASVAASQLSAQMAQASLESGSRKTGWGPMAAVIPQEIQTQANLARSTPPLQQQPQLQPAPEAPKPLPEPAVAPPPVVKAPSWGKPTVAVKSLAEIQREEAEAAAKAAAEQRRQDPQPNSFAALVKKAAAAEPASMAIPAAAVAPARVVTAQSPDIKSMIMQQQQQPLSSPPAGHASPPIFTASLMTGSELSKWTMEALKPLSPAFDCSMIACVLADCRTAEDAIAFLRDNVRTKKINLQAFCRDYAARRWGVQLKEATLATMAGGVETLGDDEFVTVSRKSKK